ncbi:MAG: hypothetical protein A2566_03590 [Candidatus Zambryskibacteria bacterium RIFOXYD1_FULL_40_13]|nr:MAG: hypothetical protein UT25_C0002G0194 [Parcubacteria group bacterium GW2011_GWC1_39_12]KKR19306.1 MAG: hypothetical protein UT49_C0002G0152 [Parcubacteria group bacterium GW2011_GWF1_39_37]KKR35311.1 MAG: hypothetical protein UT68_C0004G0119 [Parcubacteria group bacterium GW2011_GWC2_40_10]KKR52257.1 MAG: hypothetical protein UT89_C0002G0058 [Parcubacteria group bacterium GW2011_GWE1_40_20]KKR65081.1 MAG: hypothetical protein UU06_C0029G0003 [Parcubacteria group bacterium GW2011_GWB1_40_
MIFEWAVRKKLFRNINHVLWFMMSVYILALIVAYYFYPNSKIVILLPIAIHLTAFFQAIYSYIKKISSESISRDCIWWNLFMLFIYSLLLFVIKLS